MKVLLIDNTKAFLTPGGKTTHALKLQQEISKLGVDIQFAKWWDQSQADADIIHFLAADVYTAELAKKKGLKTFFSMIFDFESSKTNREKLKERLKIGVKKRLPGVGKQFYWNALPYMDRVHFMHLYDKKNAMTYFPDEISESKTVLIPHAYDPNEINISENLDIAQMSFPEKYLVSCANIAPRKQTLKLAKLAKKAQVPIVFIGGIGDKDYFKKFEAEIDSKFVFYPGYVSKEWKDCIESHAAGYALLSLGESGCIAVYEAAAYKIPLLLSNLPWAWGYENPSDIYFCDAHNDVMAERQLKEFFQKAGHMDHAPFTIRTWGDVAKLYVHEYERLLQER